MSGGFRRSNRGDRAHVKEWLRTWRIVALISVKHLSKRYGSTYAVDDVSFDVSAGEIVGLIGPNGAGKSTLLKSLLGLIHYDGEVSVLDRSPRGSRAALLESMSYIADVASLPEWISVEKLLDFMAGVHPGFSRDRAMQYLERTAVTTNQRVRALSKGMKTQLHLALIMGVESKLLILDEPTLGLDIIFRTEFYDTLANDYFTPRRSIVVTTHQVEEIEQYLTRVMFIHRGRILLDMPKSDIAGRFLRLTTAGDSSLSARRLGPIHVRRAGENELLIFENRTAADLQKFGTVDVPGIAELFVAKVKGDDSD